MVWTVLVTAKATNKENLQQPTQIQKTEAIPGPEAFPAVVLPKPKPTKPTTEDFQKLMLEKKGITPEMLEQRKSDNVPAEDLEAAEKEPLTFCTIGNQVLPCCYRSTPDNLYLRCWGAVSTATFMDPDNNGYGMTACPYPIYPFNATQVMMAINTSDTYFVVVFRPEIWSATYIDGSPYPDEPIYIGPEYTMIPPSGTYQVYLSLGADVCLYEPWFAVMTYMNTDDRYDSAYCPTGNHIPDYQSWIYDITGRLGQSYWGPYAEYGLPYGWFDVVPNGICSGAIRVRTQGYNRPENACPILPDDYWYKVGMTDFTQYYPGVPGPAYCGPAAGANSVWWFACVDSQFPPSWGGCNPGDEIALINQIAAAAGTDPVLGTNCDALEAALIGLIKAAGGWWFEETTVYAPDFWYLQYKLRTCEDVVLLLGFWQEDPPGTWNRFGGHFVTLAGVDYTNFAFALSDPATPEGYDNYFVAWPSVSPGGIVWIPDYYLPWPDFQGQNAGPLPNTGTYNPLLPVYVEVEQAIVVSPGLKPRQGEIYGAKAYEVENNHGGIDLLGFRFKDDTGIKNGLYKGSLILGTSQDDLNCDYGDYYPTMTFDPLGPPVNDSFQIAASQGDSFFVQQLTNVFAHRFIPGLEIFKYTFAFPDVRVSSPEYCGNATVDIFVIHDADGDISDLQPAIWLDFDISSGGTGDLVDTNSKYQSMWMWDQAAPDSVYGITLAPAKASEAITGYSFSQSSRVYDGQYMDSLKYWMENIGWGVDDSGVPEDRSILIANKSYTLSYCDLIIIIIVKWSYTGTIAPGGSNGWFHQLYDELHHEGFYRGDVNRDRNINVSDVIYTINYLFKGGPKPELFPDQGDVDSNNVVNVTDVIYTINYLFKGGLAPIDWLRFFYLSPYVNPTHKAALRVRNPGLFGDPQWRDLGK